jgi:antitoxin ChpS
MYDTKIRKVGGSLMFAVPPALLSVLALKEGSTVGLEVEAGRLVVHPNTRPRLDLSDLLAKCDFSVPVSPEDEAWLTSRPVGDEIL